jgi:hypothetical protein
MRFLNFQFFGGRGIKINLMDLKSCIVINITLSVIARASSRAKRQITFVWTLCMEAQNGRRLPRFPSQVG